MRVLVVIEDDDEMAVAVAVGLHWARMSVDVALDGVPMPGRAPVTDYDVIGPDRDLPGMHGDEICAKLVGAGRRSGVLMLAAATAMEDPVDGLGLGADDYLAKPSEFPISRLRTQLGDHPVITTVVKSGSRICT